MLCAFIGALAFWVFVAHCLTADQPFLNPRLLLDRNFAIGTLIAFVMGMLNFTSLVLFPSLLHDLRGYPDNVIGMLIAARGLGNWTAFLFIVQLTRIAPRFAIGCGLGIQAVGGFWMAQFDINLTEFDVFWSNFLMGLGQSVAFTPMTVMAFATLPRHQITEGCRRVHADAQFRLQPVHLAGRAGAGALDQRQLRAHDGVHHALPQGADVARPAGALEPGDGDRAAAAVERDPAPGGDDRLRQCLLPDGLHRAGGAAARLPAAQGPYEMSAAGHTTNRPSTLSSSGQSGRLSFV